MSASRMEICFHGRLGDCWIVGVPPIDRGDPDQGEPKDAGRGEGDMLTSCSTTNSELPVDPVDPREIPREFEDGPVGFGVLDSSNSAAGALRSEMVDARLDLAASIGDFGDLASSNSPSAGPLISLSSSSEVYGYSKSPKRLRSPLALSS